MLTRLTTLVVTRKLLAGAVAAVLALAVSGAVVFALVSSDDGDDETAVAPTSTPRPSPSASPTPAASSTAAPSPTATPIPVVPGANAEDRIVIEKANVDAPISLKTVPAGGGELPSPLGPDDVVFYDFANFPGLGGYPGSGGRLVLSGHVDYGGGYCDNGTEPPPCTAVFWDLTRLEDGDVVEIRVAGTVHRYRVTGSDNLGAADQEKWDDVWQASETESIALITCGGDFNRETQEYDSRHVVYAERIEDET
jgi:LPXTG-site transpeptidase (sortase) family protein